MSEIVRQISLHRKLVEIAYRWVLKRGSCGVAFKELHTHANGEHPDVIGFGAWGHSVLIEVKCSRNDFRLDRKKKVRQDPEKGMGRYRYYCCPTGLIKPEELPEKWGLIYVSEKGKATCIHRPHKFTESGGKVFLHFDQNIKAEHGFMYSALRRLHLRNRIDEIYFPMEETNPHALTGK